MAISSYKSLRAFEHLFISMQVITFWNVFLFKIAIYIIRNVYVLKIYDLMT